MTLIRYIGYMGKYKKHLRHAAHLILVLGAFLSVTLILINQVMVTIVPVSAIAGSVDLKKGLDSYALKSDVSTIFVFQPMLLTSSINAPSNSNKIKLEIVDITIANAFNHKFLNYNVSRETSLADILKISNFVEMTVHSQSVIDQGHNIYKNVFWSLLVGFVLSIGVVFLFSMIFIVIDKILLRFFIRYNDNSLSKKIVLLITSVCLMTVVALSISVCFCGLLSGDDGFFNLMAKYPQDVLTTGTPTLYYKITHLLFLISGSNIVLFRAESLFLNFLAVLFLTYALVRFYEVKFNANMALLGRWVFFVLLYISSSFLLIHHTTPDYNVLSKVIVFCQVAILIMLFGNIIGNNISRFTLVILLGFLTGFNIFIKFPESVASTVIILIVLFIIPGKFFKLVTLFIIGYLFALLTYFTLIQHPHDAWMVFNNTMQVAHMLGGHQASELLLNNFRDIGVCLVQVAVVVSVYHFITCRAKFLSKRLEVLLSGCVVVLLIAIFRSLPLSFPVVIHYLKPLVFSLLCIIGLIIYENIRQNVSRGYEQRKLFKQVNIISVILLVMVYVASVGTDIDIVYHAIFHIPLLCSIIMLQWLILDETVRYKLMLLIILIVSIGIIFIKGIIYNSYMYVNLTQQNVPYQIDVTNRVYLDQDTVSGLDLIRNKLYLCGYSNGDYIAGYYNMPALVFALGARSPVNPWYAVGFNHESTLKVNEFMNSLMSNIVKQHLFILVDELNKTAEVDLGLNNYTDCGRVDVSPYPALNFSGIKIYKSK